MSIDDKIKQELLNETKDLNNILESDPGLFTRVFSVYKSKMRYWMVIVSIAGTAATVAFIWFFYQFYLTSDTNEKIFWGICFIATLLIQTTIKQWFFMEANRMSTLREIKRIEFAVERLERALLKKS